MFKKRILLVCLVLMLAFATWTAAAGNVVDQRSVLSGTVLSQGLIWPGTMVKEGDVILMVQTIVGPAPAVRANADGRLKEITVRPGDYVRTGDVLARIEPVQR